MGALVQRRVVDWMVGGLIVGAFAIAGCDVGPSRPSEDLAPGHTTDLTPPATDDLAGAAVDLASGGADAATAHDLGLADAGHDLATSPPDLALTHDLAVTHDLAIAHDLATPPDLTVAPPDLTVGPDLAPIVDLDLGVPDLSTPPLDDGGVDLSVPPLPVAGQIVIAYGAATTSTTAVTLQLQEPNDLVANAGFETNDFTSWQVTKAGDGWAITKGLFGAYAAISSYSSETISQTIDLLAAGYTTAQLDAIPTLNVRQWYIGGGFDTADHYKFHVELRSATNTALATYDTGALTTTSSWQYARNQFTGYPAGVRSVAITTTASDHEFWAGTYGAVVDQASVVVGTIEMSLSNDNLTWSAWAPFSALTPWTIGSTAGVQTVYVQFRDGSGTILGGTSDTITYTP